jgi:hypothetical protein
VTQIINLILLLIRTNDLIWIISVLAISLGGTFAILYAMKHIMASIDRRRNR